jgi:shikimate kinase
MSSMNMQNIFLIGPMGAGKTSIGRILAKELQMDFYDSDQVVEARAGVDILWIYDIEGEQGFREREKRVIAELVQLRGIVLATGGSTVILPENRAALTANGKIIYLKTSLDDQVRRTSYSKKRPLAFEEVARRNILQSLRKEYDPIYQELADIVYDTDRKATRLVVAELIKLLQELP